MSSRWCALILPINIIFLCYDCYQSTRLTLKITFLTQSHPVHISLLILLMLNCGESWHVFYIVIDILCKTFLEVFKVVKQTIIQFFYWRYDSCFVICHTTKHKLEEDSTHVMIKVMLPIICLRNHNSKITGASPMLR